MYGWGMMEGWGLMGGFGFIFWLLILVAIIAGLVWFVRSPLAGGSSKARSPGLELLEQRYARGEITRFKRNATSPIEGVALLSLMPSMDLPVSSNSVRANRTAL